MSTVRFASRPLAALEQLTVFQSALVLGAVLALPRLGAVGLWDPWETHYAEVGRQMLARADVVHPYWQNAWFFSKPPLVMWLDALALWLSGAQPWGIPGVGALPAGVEWAIRLPFALALVFAGAVLAATVGRAVSRRAGLLTALVWWTMPMFDFIARQAMTDGLVVSCFVVAVCWAMDADDSPQPARAWTGVFTAVGLGLLAKGLVALLPLVVLGLAWATLDGRDALARLKRIPWWTPLVSLALAAPWYLAMARFAGRDDEGKTFVERFFLHDHFDRLVSGVHTTTPGGSFTYFIEQGAWASFPWVLLLPAALMALVTMPREGRPWRLAVTWAVAGALTFTLFTASATRFHHYVLPMLPALVVLVALGADRLWDDARSFAPVVALGLVGFGLVTKDLVARPRHFLDLFTYNHDRPYPEALTSDALWALAPAWLTMKSALGAAAVVTALVVTWAVRRGNGRRVVTATAAFALGLAAFLSWQHWPQLGRHWTQRELVDLYFSRSGGREPLVAFFMNWKGETFYTRNAVIQVGARDPHGEVTKVLAASPRAWFLVEHPRVDWLRRALPPNTRLTPVAPETTNKFVLMLAEHGP